MSWHANIIKQTKLIIKKVETVLIIDVIVWVIKYMTI